MMASETDEILIWLRRLIVLLGGTVWSLERQNAADRAAMAYATELARDFPVSFFTDACRHELAQTLGHWPNYAQLSKALYAYRKAHPSQWSAPALEGPPLPSNWTPEDHHWFRHYRTREAEGFKGDGRGRPDGSGVLLSLLRHKAPRVYAFVTGEPAVESQADKAAQITEDAVRRTARSLSGHPLRATLIRFYLAMLIRQRPERLPLFEEVMDAPGELHRAYSAILEDCEARELHGIAADRITGLRPPEPQQHQAAPEPVATGPPPDRAMSPEALLATYRAIAEDPNQPASARATAAARVRTLTAETPFPLKSDRAYSTAGRGQCSPDREERQSC